MQIQGITAKEPRTKESWPNKVKQADGKAPALTRFKSTEPGKTSCTDKKIEYLEKKKKKRDRKNNTSATGITLTPLRFARRRNGITEAMGGAIIVKRSAIFRETVRNLQKTSVSLGNLRAGD